MFFIKMEQVLIEQMHNSAKHPAGIYFHRFLYAGIYCTNPFLSMSMHLILPSKKIPGYGNVSN